MEQKATATETAPIQTFAEVNGTKTYHEGVTTRDGATLRVTRQIEGNVTTVHIGVRKGNADEYFQIRYDSATGKSIVSAGTDDYSKPVTRNEIFTQSNTSIAQAMVSAAERVFADGTLSEAELSGMLNVRTQGRDSLASESRMTAEEACALLAEISTVGVEANQAPAAKQNAQNACRNR